MIQPDFQLLHHYDTASWPEWGSAPRKPLIQLDMAHKGELLDSVIGPDPATGKSRVYHILRCELCILTHIWPIPSEADLALYYEREFYENEKPDMIANYEADAEWWSKCMHGPMLDAAAAAITSKIFHVPHILDIGAGPGLLLRNARDRGWSTHAIELSPLCAKRIWDEKIASVSRGPLRGYWERSMEERPKGWLDIVTMWEVLEHLPNPEEALLQVWDLLKPGGVVAICVPNEWNPLQMAACQQHNLPNYWLSAPAHISYFSPKTTQLLLRRTGFEIVDLRGTFPMETFLLDGRCYVGHGELGRQCHKERMALELADVEQGQWPEREAQYRANMQQRIGREIIAIGRKHA